MSKMRLNSSIDMKFDVETCRPFIPSTNWRNLNNEQHTSTGSILNEEQHGARLKAPISDQNSELQYLLENHFGL
jgi:hypothetical protein